MSRPKDPEPVKLISSIFSEDRELLNKTIADLSDKFGNIDYITEYIPFDLTQYYEREMGQALKRRIVSFENLIGPETLPDIKHVTNNIEQQSSYEGKRMVNIDPGYLSKAHVILATGKAYTHRPYLRSGIYADLTLIYRRSSFESLEWTYPDYAGKKIRKIMSDLRKKYLTQLKNLSSENH